MGTIITLQKKHAMVSPFLASLLRFKDRGDLCVECINNDTMHINIPNDISKEDWQSYLMYLRTGCVMKDLLDQKDGIMAFMGHDRIDPDLPIEYRRAVYRDEWAMHQGIDAFMCKEYGTEVSNVYTTIIPSTVIRCWTWNIAPTLGALSNADPIALLRSIPLPHERIITNGKHMWMTHAAHYMYIYRTIYIDGLRLHEYDLPFLIAWHESDYHLQMINASIPTHVHNVPHTYLLMSHDDAIYALCAV